MGKAAPQAAAGTDGPLREVWHHWAGAYDIGPPGHSPATCQPSPSKNWTAHDR